MSQPPRPPPGFEERPSPGALVEPVAASVPPPAEGEGFETDVLKRQAKFSWKNFGGDGFLVSVGVHLLLAIIGVFYVISRYTEPPKKPEDIFSSGSGGGSGGEKAKNYEHKMKSQRLQVSMPARIVSKSASASISLPAAPNTAASFSAGLSGGGVSKGSGGGAGGGDGAGLGIGKGAGRNFVSLFGSKDLGGTLSGCIYDFFQTNKGKPSKYPQTGPNSNNLSWMTPIVDKFIDGGWDESKLAPFFKGPATLGVSQILILRSPATAAPEAFEAKDKMVGGAWVAVYRGRVIAPESGTIRFLGNADNYIAVRFNGKNQLGYECGKTKCEPVDLGLNRLMMRGPWLSVQKGTAYDIDVLIGDAGGVFCGTLAYERKESPGKLYLFRTAANDFSELLDRDARMAAVDRNPVHKRDLPGNLDPDGPVWRTVAKPRLAR